MSERARENRRGSCIANHSKFIRVDSVFKGDAAIDRVRRHVLCAV